MNEDNKMAGGRCLCRSIFTPRDRVRVMVATYEQYTHAPHSGRPSSRANTKMRMAGW